MPTPASCRVCFGIRRSASWGTSIGYDEASRSHRIRKGAAGSEHVLKGVRRRVHGPDATHILGYPQRLSELLLALQEKVERNSQAIARLKTIWPFVAAGIAFLAAALKDWLFGGK